MRGQGLRPRLPPRGVRARSPALHSRKTLSLKPRSLPRARRRLRGLLPVPSPARDVLSPGPVPCPAGHPVLGLSPPLRHRCPACVPVSPVLEVTARVLLVPGPPRCCPFQGLRTPACVTRAPGPEACESWGGWRVPATAASQPSTPGIRDRELQLEGLPMPWSGWAGGRVIVPQDRPCW